jgi:hypothetical protein
MPRIDPRNRTDSKNALWAAENGQEAMSTRHIDVRYKWIKQKIHMGEIAFKWIDTTNMKPNGLTKAQNTTKQAQFVKLIGLTEVIREKKKTDKNTYTTMEDLSRM